MVERVAYATSVLLKSTTLALRLEARDGCWEVVVVVDVTSGMEVVGAVVD